MFCVRENGEVWIGFWGLGICRYNPQNDSFEQIVEDRDGRPLVGKNINSICEYGDWLIMAANEGELIKYNTKSHVLEDIKVAGADNTFYTTVAYMKVKSGWEPSMDCTSLMKRRTSRFVEGRPDAFVQPVG